MRARSADQVRAAVLAAVVFAAVLASSMAAAGCGPSRTAGGPSGTGRPEPRDLAGVEVREYQGQKLGSVADFPENSIKGPQYVDISKYRLTIDGAVASPSAYTYAQVRSRFERVRKVVRLDCVEGWGVTCLWEGVLLKDLIDETRPRAEAVTVIFHAVDGYTTSMPLEYARARHIVLADRINGITLPPARGFPFAVVAEDKWGYKWCRWVERIELSTDALYRGYWESRGYSRNGDRSKRFFGE